jgi:hypothetical protein
MFQRELCKHPAVQTVEYSPHTYLETHHWLKAAVLLGKAPATFAGGQVYKGYGSPANARTYIIDQVCKNIPDFKVPDSDYDLVFNGWEALCQRFAQPVFFEKSPQLLAQWGALSLMLEWIKRTDYNVKIIGLTRNPMAVQYSAFQLFHTRPEQRQYGWMFTQRNLLAFQQLLSDEQFMSVKYEDITQTPEKAFARICNFIGVPSHKGMGNKVHDQSLQKWVNDPFFRLQLDETVIQIARHFGYAEEDFYNPAKPLPPFSARAKRFIKNNARLFIARLWDRVIKPLKLRIQP